MTSVTVARRSASSTAASRSTARQDTLATMGHLVEEDYSERIRRYLAKIPVLSTQEERTLLLSFCALRDQLKQDDEIAARPASARGAESAQPMDSSVRAALETERDALRGQLIHHNLKFLYKQAGETRRLRGQTEDVKDDFFQSGAAGLMEALERFNPTMFANKLLAYAAPYIALEMDKFNSVADGPTTIPLDRRQQQRALHAVTAAIRAEKETAAREGRLASPASRALSLVVSATEFAASLPIHEMSAAKRKHLMRAHQDLLDQPLVMSLEAFDATLDPDLLPDERREALALHQEQLDAVPLFSPDVYESKLDPALSPAARATLMAKYHVKLAKLKRGQSVSGAPATEPTDDELMARLGWTALQLAGVRSSISTTYFLDGQHGTADAERGTDSAREAERAAISSLALTDRSDVVFNEADAAMLRPEMKRTLDEKDYKVLSAYWGLDNKGARNLEEVGKLVAKSLPVGTIIGVSAAGKSIRTTRGNAISRERVRIIRDEAYDKLRKNPRFAALWARLQLDAEQTATLG